MVVKHTHLVALILVLIFVIASFVGFSTEAQAALQFYSGFEVGGTFEWPSVSGSIAINSSIVHTGSYSLRVAAAGVQSYVAYDSPPIHRTTFWIYLISAPDVDCGMIIGSSVYDIFLTPERRLRIFTGTNSTTQVSLNTWTRISVSFDDLASPNGTGKLYINGNLELTETGIDTATWDLLDVGVTRNGVTTTFLIDDVAMDASTTLADLGDIRSVASVPNAAGDLSQFDTPVGNTTAGYHYTNVDEIPYSETDYNRQAASAAAIDLYNLQNSATIGLGTTEPIQIVKTMARMKRGTGSTGSGRGIQIKDNGASTNTSIAGGTTEYAWYSRQDTTMPTGGGAWTQARFDALQTGANHGLGGTDAQDTYIAAILEILVFYRVPGNPSGLASPAQTSTSVNLTWTKGAQADNTTIRYKTGAYPDNTTDGTLGYAGTASATEVTGLSASTTYYFRAWAYSTPSGLYSTGTSDLIQATTGGQDISITPSVLAFGVVQPSTTYYAKGSAPSNPVVDGDCTFTLTNNGASTINTTIKATNFTGGGGWTLGAPDGTHARITAYYSGQNPASGVVLTTSDQTFYTGLATTAHIHWDFKFETPTSFADGSIKTSTITITATAG